MPLAGLFIIWFICQEILVSVLVVDAEYSLAGDGWIHALVNDSCFPACYFRVGGSGVGPKLLGQVTGSSVLGLPIARNYRRKPELP